MWLKGPKRPLLEYGMGRSAGGLQMTVGLFRKRDDIGRPRELPARRPPGPPVQSPGQAYPNLRKLFGSGEPSLASFRSDIRPASLRAQDPSRDGTSTPPVDP